MDILPIDLELFGNDLGQRGVHTLPHLDLGNVKEHVIIRANLYPQRRLARCWRRCTRPAVEHLGHLRAQAGLPNA